MTDDLVPVCNAWTDGGWCVRDQGHDGGHLPLPVTYPPRRGPHHVEDIDHYLQLKGEL